MKDPRSLKVRLRSSDFGLISQAAFVKGWTKMVGEPPAALLDDRSAMIDMLVETAEIAPLPWADEPSRPSETKPSPPEPEVESSPALEPLRRAG